MGKDTFDYGIASLGVNGLLGNPNYPKILDNTDGESLYKFHYRNSFRKTLSMFEYENLPDTISKRDIELNTQSVGYSAWFKFEDKVYCSYCRLGGIPKYNYLPSKAIITNPYLKYFAELEIDKDCVIMPNDNMYMGLSEINSYYSYQLKDNDISRRMLMINLRAMTLLTAEDDDDYQNCVDFIKDLEKGKLSAIHSSAFKDRISALPYSSQHSAQTLIQIIEDKQYIKGSWLNELGVQSNYNMKRETITSNENILNVDGLLPLTDEMLECRKEAIDKVNKMFGLDISVDFSSSWSKIRKEIKISEERQEKEVQNLNNDKFTNMNNEDKGEDNNE